MAVYFVLTTNELDRTFRVRNCAAKFHQYRVRLATVGEVTDRQTDREIPMSLFIICPRQDLLELIRSGFYAHHVEYNSCCYGLYIRYAWSE